MKKTGQGTMIADAIEAQPWWKQAMINVLGVVLVLPLTSKTVKAAWLELVTEHEHEAVGFSDILQGLLGAWGIFTLFALLGVTILIPKLAMMAWRPLWKLVPAKFRGEK